MTLDKAIKRLEEVAIYLGGLETREDLSAIKLAIEALKRIQKKRRGLYYSEVGLLPSETIH